MSVQDVCKECERCVKGARLCARVRPSSSRERAVYVQWRPRGRRSFECRVRVGSAQSDSRVRGKVSR